MLNKTSARDHKFRDRQVADYPYPIGPKPRREAPPHYVKAQAPWFREEGEDVRVGFSFKVTKVEARDYGTDWSVFITAEVANRISGEPLSLTFSNNYLKTNTPTKADAIRKGIMWAVSHEVDESILEDGSRPFDPHRPDTYARRLQGIKVSDIIAKP